MAVAETSRMSLQKVLINEDLYYTRQEQVLRCIVQHGPLSDRAISDVTGLPINVVTARRNELLDHGDIDDAGIAWDLTTNRRVHVWIQKKAQ